MYLAALQALALAPGLITQNVDNLHRKALARALEALEATGGRGIKTEAETETEARILELHGTLARVHCLEHMHEHTRDTWQAQLAELNPRWDEAATEMEVTGR